MSSQQLQPSMTTQVPAMRGAVLASSLKLDEKSKLQLMANAYQMTMIASRH
jgi:hypothetical protein